jgi:hypothetical protein
MPKAHVNCGELPNSEQNQQFATHSISEELCGLGYRTTIAAAPTLLWGPAFPIRPSISPWSSNAEGIVSTAQVECWRILY